MNQSIDQSIDQSVNQCDSIYCCATYYPKTDTHLLSHIPESQEAGHSLASPPFQSLSQATIKALAGATISPATAGSASKFTPWLLEGLGSFQDVGLSPLSFLPCGIFQCGHLHQQESLLRRQESQSFIT